MHGMRHRALAGLAVTAIATSAIAASAGADTATKLRAAAKTPVVKVADDFFAPTSVTIKKGQRVKWKWDRNNINPHNVVVTKQRPKGVKKRDFKSGSGSTGMRFAPKFKKPGKYGFICTFHRTTMKMTVTVKRR